MSFTYAGRYSEPFIDPAGRDLPGVAITVYLRGTTTKATLYTDRTKVTAAANPATTDTYGNGTFFADPGEYDLLVNGLTLQVTVPLDPGELAALSRTAVKTANYSAAANELVPVDTTSAAVTVTLPNAPAARTSIVVKHIVQGGTNAVTIACAGSDVFNRAGGPTTATLSLLNQALFLEYDATAAVWTVISDDLPLSGLDGRYVPLTQKGAASGVATLDGSGTIPDAQIPAAIARDTEVATAVAALVNSAPTTLDTLAEIATALGNDPNLATTLTTSIALKAAKAANLSDLADAATARGNIGASAKSKTINTQTADYTLALTDADGVVELNKATAINLTVPPNSSVAFPIGTVIRVVQLGAGTATVVQGAGVTVAALRGTRALGGQYDQVQLVKRATDEWEMTAPSGTLGLPLALTGAVAATRYVGGTVSGAPTAGTFAVGDFVIDQSGIVWICTVAGTQGTWVDASSSGKELAYAAISSSLTTTALGGANAVDAAGLIITVPATTRPIVVEFVGNIGNLTAGDGVGIFVVEGAAGDAVRATVRQQVNTVAVTGASGAAQLTIPAVAKVRLASSGSSRTFKVQYCATTGGTAIILSGSTSQPAYLTAYSV